PHPDSPATPPWNRLVDPAWGVVDKVRDAVTGRRTYPIDSDDDRD
ncbi:hemerythrin domain-containing protein, partial [Micromonospora sp. KC721]